MAQGVGGGQGGTGGRGGRGGRGQEHARNSGEFSRNCAHVVLARAHCHRRPPVRPGSILRLTQQRISPTRQRILLLVTVSEYRCRRRRNFRPRRIYPREARRQRHGGSPHAFSSARRRRGSLPLHFFLSPLPLSLTLSSPLSLSFYISVYPIYPSISLWLSSGQPSLRRGRSRRWRKRSGAKRDGLTPLAVPLCSATVACQVPFSLFAAARLVAGLACLRREEQCYPSD